MTSENLESEGFRWLVEQDARFKVALRTQRLEPVIEVIDHWKSLGRYDANKFMHHLSLAMGENNWDAVDYFLEHGSEEEARRVFQVMKWFDNVKIPSHLVYLTEEPTTSQNYPHDNIQTQA